MSMEVTESVGIETVDDLIACLEDYPGNLPVQVAGVFRLRLVRSEHPPHEPARYRRGSLLIVGDDEGA
ncbi:MAG: hypothetical protein KDH15_13870 [Rhodocyclaceae bacterium]|nr:hypothetical protein [Rhodocyclaceae bacterium]